MSEEDVEAWQKFRVHAATACGPDSFVERFHSQARVSLGLCSEDFVLDRADILRDGTISKMELSLD